MDFVGQQTIFSAFTSKHDAFCCAMNSRETSNSIYLCPCIGPVPTTATKVPSSPARALLLGGSSDYGLLFTSGVHRLLGPCEGRRSWRRPNDTPPATSNCNTHDPVTRRLHRQHLVLVHPQFVRAWMWSKAGFTSWNLLFSQMGPRWAGSGGASPGVPNPPPGPPRRLAAQGGKGELRTALASR
jgi:hypothetical protein